MAKCLQNTNTDFCTDLSPGVVTYKYADEVKQVFLFYMQVQKYYYLYFLNVAS